MECQSYGYQMLQAAKARKRKRESASFSEEEELDDSEEEFPLTPESSDYEPSEEEESSSDEKESYAPPKKHLLLRTFVAGSSGTIAGYPSASNSNQLRPAGINVHSTFSVAPFSKYIFICITVTVITTQLPQI